MKLIFSRGRSDEPYLKRAFSWLARIGAAPKFGSRPIGWYQMHVCACLRYLEQSKAAGFPVRCKRGMVQYKPTIGPWQDVATVEQLWTIGDKRN
jgi:hypothetical protein